MHHILADQTRMQTGQKWDNRLGHSLLLRHAILLSFVFVKKRQYKSRDTFLSDCVLTGRLTKAQQQIMQVNILKIKHRYLHVIKTSIQQSHFSA